MDNSRGRNSSERCPQGNPLVQTGTYCTSTPAPPSNGVLTPQLPDGSPVGKSTPGHASPVPPDAVTVINPAAMPAGTELSFTYSNHNHDLTGGLIYTAAHTCSSTPQQDRRRQGSPLATPPWPGPHRPGHARNRAECRPPPVPRGLGKRQTVIMAEALRAMSVGGSSGILAHWPVPDAWPHSILDGAPGSASVDP